MFVGRAAERAEIDRILAGAHGGRSGTLLLVGDPGVGKTALLEDAVARAGDFCVVRAGGFETEAGLAFAGLDALVRPFASRIDSLPPPQAAALAGALALGPPAPGDRFTVSVAALSLFAGAAEERPLLLVVDDAQWLDPASLDCLAFVARRLTAEAIGLLVGARDVPPAALQRTRGIAVLRIEGLPEAEAVQLVRSHAPTTVADHVATKLAEQTAGNPLALIETTAALSTDQLAGVTPLPDVFSAGPGMTRALLSHLLPLSPVCRRALVIAAAGSGAPALISSALRDAGIDDALLEAEAADIVTIGAEGILFRHPLLRAATYAAASGPERRAAHAALADAAGALGDPGVEERARHLAAATDGPDDDVAAVVEEAGRRAAARMGYAEAAEAIRRAAQLTTMGASRAPRLLEASMFAMMAGRAAVAGECLDQAVREAGDPVVAATARVARAHLEMMTGDVERARDMLVGEAERPGVDAATSASLLAEGAHAAGMAGDAEGGTLARASEARLPDDAPATIRTQVDITVAVWAVLRGDPDWAERMARVTDPMGAAAPGDPLGWARVAMFLNPLVAVGNFSAARELADRLIGIGRALSAPSLLPYPLASRGHLLTATGDWDGALTDADEARRLGEQTGQRSVAAFARCVLARILAARGDENACRATIRAVQDGIADAAGDSLVNFEAAAAGLLEMGLGRFGAALQEFDRGDRVARNGGLRSHGTLPYLDDMVEAAVRADRPDLATRALAYLEEQEPLGIPRALSAIERARGIVADNAARAIAHFEAAVAHAELAQLPFDRARCQLLLGERLNHARRRRDAIVVLSAALGTFDALDAAPWAERTAAMLGTLGARPQERHPRSTRDLTRMELQVARAAAEGLSNREIAAQFFLSVKTVEFHLRNTYGKMGVRSRTQLAARLNDPGRVR